MAQSSTHPPSIQSDDILATLGEANQRFQAVYPGEREDRQPVHTVYGGAQLYRAETPKKLGERALSSLEHYAPSGWELATALGLWGADRLPRDVGTRRALEVRFEAAPLALQQEHPEAWLALMVHARVRAKLEREPVEDFRIDFEDGYGVRSDAEEDGEAVRTAQELAKSVARGDAPPFMGIRIKPLTEELKLRSVRTLDRFVSTLLQQTGGRVPDGFVITLPKVTLAAQVTAMEQLCTRLEDAHGLARRSLRVELMVETPQAMIGMDGRAGLSELLEPAGERVTGVHFGTYDYTALCQITASHQRMDHPACDHARMMMIWACSGRGLFLSDGATNVMPVGPHAAPAGRALTTQQMVENREAVHAAWRLGYDHIRHSLETGFYQGWDLHPAQLPVRYAACYSFFLEGWALAARRLKNFVDQAAQATLVGDVFDDAATGQGLLNYFLRALNCGAVSESEVAVTGLTLDEIRMRSFAKILSARRARLSGGVPPTRS